MAFSAFDWGALVAGLITVLLGTYSARRNETTRHRREERRITGLLRQAGFQGRLTVNFSRKVGQFLGSDYYPSVFDPVDQQKRSEILRKQRQGLVFYPWTDRNLIILTAIFGGLTAIFLFLAI